MKKFTRIAAPSRGEKIKFKNGLPVVPDNPIIPFIRGDGTGVDIWPATQKVIDASIKKAYGSTRKIEWLKIFAGDDYRNE